MHTVNTYDSASTIARMVFREHSGRMRTPSLLLLATLLLAACGTSEPTPTPPPEPTPSSAAAAVLPTGTKEEVATAVVTALQQGKPAEVAKYAHPEKGVRFTPYTYVNPETDVILTAAEIAAAASDTTHKTWGVQEGSGEPISMSVLEYFSRYVYNHDYATAPVVRWNEPQTKGSMIDNAKEFYPAAQIVEYHFDGFDPKYEGMDWGSLRLALEEHEGAWFVTGMIHDEWTP